jgi:hypothetical protein
MPEREKKGTLISVDQNIADPHGIVRKFVNTEEARTRFMGK